MADPTIPQRLDALDAQLDNLPTDQRARHAALLAVIATLTKDWPRDAYPRLTKISQRAARLWIEHAARLPTRRR
jgi:hypothetical protein